MKRSCFALSILMASLSGSLLWGDAARTSNRRAPLVVAPRDAAARPPHVEDDSLRDCDSQRYNCPSRSDDFAYDDFDCGYSNFIYDTCSYDPRLHGPSADLHPADLPEGLTREYAIADDSAEVNPLFLSHYDPLYDAAVYGVDVYLTEEVAYPAPEQSSYAHETFDYRAYSECYDDRYTCYGYDYGYEEDPLPVEVAEAPQLYGHYYERHSDYEYNYNYDYEYDYDYQYEYEYEDASPGRASAVLNPQESRVVLNHLRDFVRDLLSQCEPIGATMEAGCKIVAWGSGFDATRLWDAAGANIAELPQNDKRATR
jgi:hypothetical protein